MNSTFFASTLRIRLAHFNWEVLMRYGSCPCWQQLGQAATISLTAACAVLRSAWTRSTHKRNDSVTLHPLQPAGPSALDGSHRTRARKISYCTKTTEDIYKNGARISILSVSKRLFYSHTGHRIGPICSYNMRKLHEQSIQSMRGRACSYVRSRARRTCRWAAAA